MIKRLTLKKENGNMYELSARTSRKNAEKTFLKKVKKMVKKCLTNGKGLWYDIQAVAARVDSPNCSSDKED